ncbi:hypothetical protein U9M48_034198 [Paspalum notatum var. saurae]|uniref:Uncharacterized protein n=1 Tax=Paspalum notatum var. saurae TaxID=547442 RepID=A0AAQ3U999_PASNO
MSWTTSALVAGCLPSRFKLMTSSPPSRAMHAAAAAAAAAEVEAVMPHLRPGERGPRVLPSSFLVWCCCRCRVAPLPRS